METLVVVAQHRNQYYSRSQPQFHERFRSSHSGGFRDINCRFQSEAGILPSPFKSCDSCSTSVMKASSSPNTRKAISSPSTQKGVTPSSERNRKSKNIENSSPIHIKFRSKNIENSSPIPIKFKLKNNENSNPVLIRSKSKNIENTSSIPVKYNEMSSPIPKKFKEGDKQMTYEDDFYYSELWAGPAYSNSPPPSSLPIPKFSLRQNRSVSLDLPTMETGIKFHPLAKSAPSSPRRDLAHSPNVLLSAASATKDLRRILHLEIADE